ncbi:MAG: protein-L-isoaspartate(D-aspartate) O-methyltransferase [Pirellulaceae bacterium]
MVRLRGNLACLLGAWAVGAMAAVPASAQTRAQLDAGRQRMVQIAIIDAGVKNSRVIDAMRRTPRHEFIPRASRKLAYEDMALPIGEQQTISSPFIVAFMTEAIDPQPTDRVLEIGTGSGYQAAVLSGLVKEVYTIEIVEPLGRTAQRTLEGLHYTNVHVKIGDGFQGWPEHAPFDKIVVTCSPESVPQPLVDQLQEGGLIVIPVGPRYQQVLHLMRKREGQLVTESTQPTLFVPMTGTAEATRKVQPNPLDPTLHNGGFEEPTPNADVIPGWYYQRQVRWVADKEARQGEHFITFHNDEPGKPAIIMQGFPVDGRQVTRLEVSAWIKCVAVEPGRDSDEMPAVVVTFYDENRKPLGNRLIGPFRGTSPWQQQREEFRVPTTAREAILRIGLFGAVGEIAFDGVQVRVCAQDKPDK